MSQQLAWFFAFVAAAAVVTALGLALAAIGRRHPDLLLLFKDEEGEESWSVRSWRLGIALAGRELPGSRLEGLRNRIARNLARTAAPSRLTPEVFLGQALVEGVAIMVVLVVLSSLAFGRPSLLLSALAGLGYSFLLRPLLLENRAVERVAKISKRLPYSIDLAVLFLGAGGTLREALEMLAQTEDGDPLAEELAFAITEMRTGTPQSKALRDMANRVQLDELTTLVLGINRGEETGAPMTSTFEIQSEVFRSRRLQKVEKLAVEAPVKMMGPNMIIMVAVLLVIIGPFLMSMLMGPSPF